MHFNIICAFTNQTRTEFVIRTTCVVNCVSSFMHVILSSSNGIGSKPIMFKITLHSKALPRTSTKHNICNGQIYWGQYTVMVQLVFCMVHSTVAVFVSCDLKTYYKLQCTFHTEITSWMTAKYVYMHVVQLGHARVLTVLCCTAHTHCCSAVHAGSYVHGMQLMLEKSESCYSSVYAQWSAYKMDDSTLHTQVVSHPDMISWHCVLR